MSSYMTCVDCGESLMNPLHDRCERCEEELRDLDREEESDAAYEDAMAEENRS